MGLALARPLWSCQLFRGRVRVDTRRQRIPEVPGASHDEAIVDPDGHVRLLEPIVLPAGFRLSQSKLRPAVVLAQVDRGNEVTWCAASPRAIRTPIHGQSRCRRKISRPAPWSGPRVRGRFGHGYPTSNVRSAGSRTRAKRCTLRRFVAPPIPADAREDSAVSDQLTKPDASPVPRRKRHCGNLATYSDYYASVTLAIA